jgi:hypothetical protein
MLYVRYEYSCTRNVTRKSETVKKVDLAEILMLCMTDRFNKNKMYVQK